MLIVLAWIEFILLVIATVALFIRFMDGIEETQSYAVHHVESDPAPYGLSWWEMHKAVRQVLKADKRRPYRCR